MSTETIKIVTFVPPDNADAVRRALGDKGAGTIGHYSFCSFSVIGNGRFTPSDNAKPHVGQRNVPEIVKEERIEVVCQRSNAKEVLRALKDVHPYEEVAFDLYPLLSEADL